jgi:hypothetical protein
MRPAADLLCMNLPPLLAQVGGWGWEELHKVNSNRPWQQWAGCALEQHSQGELQESEEQAAARQKVLRRSSSRTLAAASRGSSGGGVGGGGGRGPNCGTGCC